MKTFLRSILFLMLPALSLATNSSMFNYCTGCQDYLGSGGSGGASSLGVNFNGVSVTSPTAQINFVGPGVSVVGNGSTSTVTISSWPAGGSSQVVLPLPASATNYWQYPSTGTFVGTYGINTSSISFSSMTLASGYLTDSLGIFPIAIPGGGAYDSYYMHAQLNSSIGFGLGGAFLISASSGTTFDRGAKGGIINLNPTDLTFGYGQSFNGVQGANIVMGANGSTVSKLATFLDGINSTTATINNLTSLPVQADASHNLYGAQISLSSSVVNILPVANGGTGTASPGLVAGSNITSITGTWPNQTINAAAGGGGGTSSLGVFNGTVLISSPTGGVSFDSNTLSVVLQGGATAYVTIKTSSITAQGNAFNGASQLVQLNGSTQLPAISGALLTNIPTTALTGTVQAAQFPALTGDFTTSAGSLATTAAATQANIRTFSGPITNTSSATFTANIVVSSSVLLGSAPGTSGQVLTSGGNGAVPTWTTPTVGTVTSVTGTPPINSSGGATPAISLSQTIGQVETFTSSTTYTAVIQSTGVYVSSATVGFDEYANGAYAAISTVTWQNSNKQKVTLTANTTFLFVAPAHPASLILRIATGSGGFTASWPGTVKWAAGAAPTITATASKNDIIACYYASDGNYYCVASQNF